MSKPLSIVRLLGGAVVFVVVGCQQPAREASPPPADARRPVLRTESELAAERSARVAEGGIVPGPTPRVAADPAPAEPPPPPPAPPPQPGPGAIRADLLLINDAVLSVDEVLYPLWDQIEELRRTQTAAGFRDRVRQLVRVEVQRTVGSALIYAEAMRELSTEQQPMVKRAAEEDIKRMIDTEFGGSTARFESHLSERGLTRETFAKAVERDMVVRQYSREKLLPKVQLRRDELRDYYVRHASEFSEPEKRELLWIELPFSAFLPEGETWQRATTAAKAQAKVRAVREARAAEEALQTRPFADVAREYSRGPHAAGGGSFGFITRPLQPPYDALTARVFEYASGQHSEPIETAEGWYIVACGRIEPAVERAFVDAQDDIRKKLMEERFNRMSTDYVLSLAERATISSFETFLERAVVRAEAGLNAARAATTPMP